jgi:hypothetical protein
MGGLKGGLMCAKRDCRENDIGGGGGGVDSKQHRQWDLPLLEVGRGCWCSQPQSKNKTKLLLYFNRERRSCTPAERQYPSDTPTCHVFFSFLCFLGSKPVRDLGVRPPKWVEP